VCAENKKRIFNSLLESRLLEYKKVESEMSGSVLCTKGLNIERRMNERQVKKINERFNYHFKIEEIESGEEK
jgi:hypothetical protein